MKLWHDDVRPAPKGWVWARTNDDAERHLATGDVTDISMDHDLGLHDVDVPPPECLENDGSEEDRERFLDAIVHKGFSEETGLDLVRWMIATGNIPPRVTIHSWNPDKAMAMAQTLADASRRGLWDDAETLMVEPFSLSMYTTLQ